MTTPPAPDWRHRTGAIWAIDPAVRLASAGLDASALIEEMDEARVEIACLIGMAPGSRGPGWGLVYDLCSRHPQRLRPIASVDPRAGYGGVRELEIALRDYGFIGARMDLPLYGLGADHPGWFGYYAACCAVERPAQVVIGQPADARGGALAGHPGGLGEVAALLPELRVFATGSGWPWIAETIALARRNPGLWLGFDAPGAPGWTGEFLDVVNGPGRRRTLWTAGSPAGGFVGARALAADNDIVDAARPWLLRENARRLYDLWDLEPAPGTGTETAP